LLTQEIDKQKEILEAKKSKCNKMIKDALAIKKEISSELKELQKEIDAEKNNAVKLQSNKFSNNRWSFLSNIFYSNSIILILMYGCWHLQSIFSFQNIPCPLFFTPWPLLVSSSLALPIILFVTFWNREVTREIKVSSSNIFLSTSIFGYSFSSLKFYSSKNSLFYPLLSNLSLLFYHFAFTFYFIIFSEAILFLSIFWGHFHIIFSPIRFYLSWVILPSTCELTSTGSFLLSHASVCGGYGYTIRDKFLSSPHSTSYIILVSAEKFISLQMKEFRNLGFSMNDSIYGCLFFFLTTFHFFHLVVGLILLGLYFGNYFLFQIHFSLRLFGFHFSQFQFYPFFTIQLLYWHFIEFLWLVIDFTLYWLILHFNRFTQP